MPRHKPNRHARLWAIAGLITGIGAQYHDGGQQIRFSQPDASPPTSSDWPYRPLPWGDINILATTDTHGWLMGHERGEGAYSGDWGDLFSFQARLRQQAKQKGVDLLMVDSGDRVDGNGLVDGEPPEHVKGWTAMSYFREMPYDIVTTGNHELYKYPTAVATRQRLVSHFGERYVTSNVNLTVTNRDGLQETSPLGHRFRKFHTEMGRNVTAFGPLFDFRAHDRGINVQAPSDMVKEPWFIGAIQDKPSLFLLVGHMSVRKEPDSEWSAVVKAIRKVHSTVPIAIFGGHHHIRDCVQEDPWSMSLAAGRYMETIGFMSIKGIDQPHGTKLEFSRRYLDQNRQTYAFHAGKSFDTSKGKDISKRLTKTAQRFNLTLKFGDAPQSYYLYRYSPWSRKSILNLMTSQVLPSMIKRPDRPYESITVLNTGSIRFDIFKGEFTRNDQWIILPFTNRFLFVSGVKYSVVKRLLPYLNLVGEHHLARSTADNMTVASIQAAESARIEHVYRESLTRSANAFYRSRPDQAAQNKSLGYVTYDACDDLGDDTLHRPLPVAPQPIFVSTALPVHRSSSEPSEGEGEGDEQLVDVVFFDFIKPDIINALNYLQAEKVYDERDIDVYLTELTANTLMQEYAKREWN
ncbi:hypothetical protein OIV83_004081 [Microbotryomycetes sp. JL201]|nr:hypothetical protein OIV83_004081 [Microbotryomycetes sp. JL201]